MKNYDSYSSNGTLKISLILQIRNTQRKEYEISLKARFAILDNPPKIKFDFEGFKKNSFAYVFGFIRLGWTRKNCRYQ